MQNELQALDLQKSLLFAAVGAATIGVLFFNVMPLYLGTLQDTTGFDNSQIGLVASALFLGFNLVSASSYFWVRKIPVRIVAVISTSVLGLFLLMCVFFMNFLFIIIMSIIIGGASGALASIGATIIGDTRNSTRWYGIKVAVECAAGVVLLFLLPVTLIPDYGFKGTIVGMLLLVIAIMPLLHFLSRGRLIVEESESSTVHIQRPEGRSSLPVWLVLVATLTVFIGGSAIWAFEERIANQYGIEPAWVGTILGLSLVFAVIGPLISGALGDKFGNRGPFAIAAVLMIVGVFAIALSDQLVVYFAVGACVFMLGWGGSIPFLFAKVAASDPNGRHITLMIPALGLGSMIGPALAGFMYSGDSLALLQVMAVLTIAVSGALVWISGND